VRGLSIRYGEKVALQGVDLEVRQNEIFGLIGPANAGKTSFLRALNRMDEFVPGMQVDGTITFAGRDVRTIRNLYALRRHIGVVFPLPVGLPLSIYDNVALAPRLRGRAPRRPSSTRSCNAASPAPPCGTRSRTA
jgi:phosphate transport system ATP-binding protein